MRILLKSHPAAVSREDLYAALWPDTFVNLTNLNNVVNELRAALDDANKNIIITKHRFGYLVGVPVHREEEAGGSSRFALVIAGRMIRLREGENLVGRSGEAVVLLDLPPISRKHAVLHVEHGHAEVEDLHSKNGTFIEGQRVQQRRELNDGNTICFGSICGVFRDVSEEGVTATDPAVKA